MIDQLNESVITINSFLAISIAPLQVHYYSEALLTVSEFDAEAPQAIASEGLAQGHGRLEWDSNPR